MSALIEISSNVRCNLHDNVRDYSEGKLVMLLKEKIEYSITENKSIVVIVSNSALESRNTFYVDDYNVDQDMLYLNNGNFELHVNLGASELTYNATLDDCFTIVHNDTEVEICFLS